MKWMCVFGLAYICILWCIYCDPNDKKIQIVCICAMWCMLHATDTSKAIAPSIRTENVSARAHRSANVCRSQLEKPQFTPVIDIRCCVYFWALWLLLLLLFVMCVGRHDNILPLYIYTYYIINRCADVYKRWGPFVAVTHASRIMHSREIGKCTMCGLVNVIHIYAYALNSMIISR